MIFQTGGEDDFVSLWSFTGRNLICYGKGHTSFVSKVMFDPGHCTSDVLRFGSVGYDAKFLLWEFSQGKLQRPRSQVIFPFLLKFVIIIWVFQKSQNAPVAALNVASLNKNKVYQVESSLAKNVPFLLPILTYQSPEEPFSDIIFTSEAIVTCSWNGKTYFWIKDQSPENSEKSNPSE